MKKLALSLVLLVCMTFTTNMNAFSSPDKNATFTKTDAVVSNTEAISYSTFQIAPYQDVGWLTTATNIKIDTIAPKTKTAITPGTGISIASYANYEPDVSDYNYNDKTALATLLICPVFLRDLHPSPLPDRC